MDFAELTKLLDLMSEKGVAYLKFKDYEISMPTQMFQMPAEDEPIERPEQFVDDVPPHYIKYFQQMGVPVPDELKKR